MNAAAVRHHDVPTNDIRLHVVTAGPPTGSPVLLLHGFPECWLGWSRQIGPLAEAGYHVIVPDQRGFNASDKPPRVSDYGIDALAADALGVLDHFGVTRAHVVGHDWGGAVAWWLAMNHDDRVDRLIVLNMPHPGVMQQHVRRWAQLRKSWYIFVFQLPWLPERMLTKDGYKRLERVMFANTTTRPFTPQEIADFQTAWRQPGAVRGMLAWYRNVGRNLGFRMQGQRVSRPSRILWGRDDSALGYGMALDSVAHLDDGKLIVIDGAAHFVQHDAPERVNSEILGFLGEVS